MIEREKDAETIAKVDLDRAESLYAKKTIAEELYDAARLKFRLAAHDLRVAEFNRTIAEFERDQAQAALTRFSERSASEQSLFHHEIRAPITDRLHRF